MSLEESCLEVFRIMTRHDLVSEERSDAQIHQFIKELYQTGYGGAYPLQVVPYLNPSTTIGIYYYDDCNTYQDPNYYLEELTKIGIHSQGHINFTNLVENCDDDGIITLTYSLNGKAGKLTFSTLDTYNSVPEEYIEFVKTTINKVSGTHRYLQYEEDIYLFFCLLTVDIANELEAIKANKFVKY